MIKFIVMMDDLSTNNLKRLPEKNKQEAERIIDSLLSWIKEIKNQIKEILENK